MPTIEFSYKDLCGLLGKKIPIKQLEEDILFVKGEFEEVDGDRIKIEIADTNRPDLWSVEGIARELKARLGIKTGLPKYTAKKSGLKVYIDKKLKKIRPYTVCAVVKGLDFTDEVMLQIIQLQEKVCETFGRKRDQVAIGVYDYHKIKGPIYFKAVDPKKTKFQPLDFPSEINLLQILSKHQKGREYGHLLEGLDMFPLFVDSEDQVLSLPPIINSDHTGKVTADTHDVFIECSGFDHRFLTPALNIMVAAMMDRGGKLETVEVIGEKKMVTPELKPLKIDVDKGYLSKQLGIDLSEAKVTSLLKRACYEVENKKDKFTVSYLPYRQDILHQMDVIEDILIGYGFNNIEPVSVEFPSEASLEKTGVFSRAVADIMVGLGAIEFMSYTLTNLDNLYKKMDMDPADQKYIEVDNAVSKNWSIFRTWLTPNAMEMFSKNTNREYPQDIFEIGQVVLLDPKAETRSRNPVRMVWGHIGKVSDFTMAKQALDFLMDRLGVSYKMEDADHPSFVPGRVARVVVGKKKVAYIGEIHPQVLENWGLQMPVCLFELNLSDLIKLV